MQHKIWHQEPSALGIYVRIEEVRIGETSSCAYNVDTLGVGKIFLKHVPYMAVFIDVIANTKRSVFAEYIGDELFGCLEVVHRIIPFGVVKEVPDVSVTVARGGLHLRGEVDEVHPRGDVQGQRLAEALQGIREPWGDC